MALAGYNLIARIESFVNMSAMGLEMVRVYWSVRTGSAPARPGLAGAAGWHGLVEGFMIVLRTVLLIWSGNIISIFNVEPELLN